MSLAKKMQVKVTKSDQVEVQLALIQLEQFLEEMTFVKIDPHGRDVWLIDRHNDKKKYKLKFRKNKRPYEVVVTNWSDQGYMLLWYGVNKVNYTYEAPLLKMTLTMNSGEKLQHYFLVAPQQPVEAR